MVELEKLLFMLEEKSIMIIDDYFYFMVELDVVIYFY